MTNTKDINVTRARANWFALCDLAEVAPDTKKTAKELQDRLRSFGRAAWSEREIQRFMDEYEATL